MFYSRDTNTFTGETRITAYETRADMEETLSVLHVFGWDGAELSGSEPLTESLLYQKASALRVLRGLCPSNMDPNWCPEGGMLLPGQGMRAARL